MKNTVLRVAMCIIALWFCCVCTLSHAQNPTRDFIVNPYIPVVSSVDNTLTAATGAITCGTQPTATKTLTISGAGYAAEIYEFYANGGTYTGSNNGVEIGANATTSYTSLATSITALSNHVDAAFSTPTLTLTAVTSGKPGNFIVMATDETQITLPSPALLSGGAQPRAGVAGALIFNSTDDTVYVRETAANTSSVWKPLSTIATGTFGTITATTATLTLGTITTSDINGGAVDGTIIGAATPAAGTFTTLAATTATLTLIDGTVGSITPAAGTFTTLVGTTVNGHDEVRTLAFTYFDPDVAASQTTAQWGVDPSASVGGANFQGVPVPFAGSVIAIDVFSNAACTSGTLTADATINGTATGLQAGLNSVDDTTSSYTIQANDADTFTAGQQIGVEVTTDATWAPTTADVIVVVYVEY
jgi:hypothetical protein